MRNNGAGLHYKRANYGPTIAGVAYPAGAVNATKMCYDQSNTRWSVSYQDYLGRTFQTSSSSGAVSSSTYNNLGQMASSTDADGVTTLYVYNTQGEQIKTVLDLNNNGAVDDNTDRISWSDTYYSVSEGRYGMARVSSIAATENSSAEKEVQFSWSSLEGHHSFSQPLNDSTLRSSTILTLGPVSGSWRTTSTSASGAVSTSNYSGGYLTSSSTVGAGQLLGLMTYEYDGHRRGISTTDARTGKTSQTFAASGEVLTMTQERAAGSADDLTSTYTYDNRDRLIKVENPSGQLTYRDYDARGRTIAVWGAQTYARVYEYNQWDQMIAMRTFKDDSSFNETTPPTTSTPGFARTEWIYGASSGFLLQKRDAEGEGASYTYENSGRLATRTWARGLHTRYFYDGVNQLTNIHYFTSAAGDNGSSDPGANVGNDPNTEDLAYDYDLSLIHI